MLAPRTSTRRSIAQLIVASAAVIGTAVITGLGLLPWLATALQAAYPCGETYRVHPACRLADPDAVSAAYRLMIGVPAACTLAGVVLGAVAAVRRRRAAPPPVAAFAIALASFLLGQAQLAAALHDVVPW